MVDNNLELSEDMIFRTTSGTIIRLDRRVPGDSNRWFVAIWEGYWCFDETIVEPGDLIGRPAASIHDITEE